MTSPDSSLASIMKHLTQGVYFKAEEEAMKLVEASPDDPCAGLLLGLTVAAMGEDERAAPILNKVAAAQPNEPHPCTALARLEVPRCLVKWQFEACLAQAPDSERLRLAFVEYLLDQRNPAEA